MSNVIRFLEELGSNSARLSAAGYAANVAVLDVDAAQRRALIERDHAAINDLLGGRAGMSCVIWSSRDAEF